MGTAEMFNLCVVGMWSLHALNPIFNAFIRKKESIVSRKKNKPFVEKKKSNDRNGLSSLNKKSLYEKHYSTNVKRNRHTTK